MSKVMRVVNGARVLVFLIHIVGLTQSSVPSVDRCFDRCATGANSTTITHERVFWRFTPKIV